MTPDGLRTLDITTDLASSSVDFATPSMSNPNSALTDGTIGVIPETNTKPLAIPNSDAQPGIEPNGNSRSRRATGAF